jgi:CHAD domain-containing protein
MDDELERAQKAFRELGKSLKSLPSDPPPKAVHKLRTAARRVEAIAVAIADAVPSVDGKESRHLLKSLEPLRKAAGGVRDMDVLIANTRRLARYSAGDSLTRLIDLLESARQQNTAELRHALNHSRKTARQNLKEYSKLVRSTLTPSNLDASANGKPRHSHVDVHAPASSVVRELSEWPPFDAGNIHAFRLKVKELRYILQLDANTDPGLAEALGEVQRRVGDWHDWQHLAEIAHQVLHAEEDVALLTRIDRTVRRRLDQALTAANGLRGRYLAAPHALGA